MKKSAREKLLCSKGLPKVVRLEARLAKKWGSGTLAIPAPVEVDELMRGVAKGKLITINKIREKVAREHKADIGCPICCGIFANIAAYAAEEDRAAGKKQLTPWWRTLKGEGELNPNYPGGIENQKSLLEGEGHKVVKRGKRFFVEGYERKMVG